MWNHAKNCSLFSGCNLGAILVGKNPHDCEENMLVETDDKDTCYQQYHQICFECYDVLVTKDILEIETDLESCFYVCFVIYQ